MIPSMPVYIQLSRYGKPCFFQKKKKRNLKKNKKQENCLRNLISRFKNAPKPIGTRKCNTQYTRKCIMHLQNIKRFALKKTHLDA